MIDCHSLSTWLSFELGSQSGLKQLEVCCHLLCIEITTHCVLTAAQRWFLTPVMLRCPWGLGGPKDHKDYSRAVMRFYPVLHLWFKCHVHTQAQGSEMGQASQFCALPKMQPLPSPGKAASSKQWVSLHLPLHPHPHAPMAALPLTLLPSSEV